MNKNKRCTTANYEHIPTSYEGKYHKDKHQYLYTDEDYYGARAELAEKRYFNDISNINDKKILEWGVGLGQNIYLFTKAMGYDISEFATDFCTTKGVLATTKVDMIPNNHFDIVFSAHVLEHLENPLKTLRVIHSKLRKGGRLILITPIEVFKRKGNWELCQDVNQHLFTWTPQLMINLLIRAGFKPVENQVIPTCGYKKLLPFRKLGIGAYDLATKMAGVITRNRELKFVAVKI